MLYKLSKFYFVAMSLNLRTSEKTSSPHREPTNQQNMESKNNWSKSNGKDDESQNNLPDSPKIDSFVEAIENPLSVFKNFRQQSALPSKRLKFENEEHESSVEHAVLQEVQDDCDAFGRCVTAQLRQMPKLQKALAQRLMSEICFRGQIQALLMNTVISNPSSATTVFQQQPQPVPILTARPAPFNRGSEYLLLHQQNMRNQPHVTVGSASVSSMGPSMGPPSYQQTFGNLQQQSSEMSVSAINHVVNLGQNDN